MNTKEAVEDLVPTNSRNCEYDSLADSSLALLERTDDAVWAEMQQESPAKPPESLTAQELRDVVELSLWTGQLLLQNGAETSRVEEAVHRLGTALGCDWLDVWVSSTAIVVTTSSADEFRTKVRRVVRFGGVNMDLLADVLLLTKRVENGELDREAYRQQLTRAHNKPRQYSRWLVAVAVGLACGAFSWLFGGDGWTFAVTVFASASAMLIRQEMAAANYNHLLTVAATAFVAGSLASLGATLELGAHPHLALAASVLLLVPGVPLIHSFDDLVNGQTLVGMYRGMTGWLISLGIAVGLALAIEVSGMRNLWHGFTPPRSLLADAFWSSLAAAGFAILFNVPLRALPICALCGAGGHLIRTVLMTQGWGDFAAIEVATYLAATVVGFTAMRLEELTSLPASTFGIPAVIPMVPGVFAFGAMINLLQLAGLMEGVATHWGTNADLLVAASINILKTGLICGALAIGLKTPVLLFQRPKPVL